MHGTNGQVPSLASYTGARSPGAANGAMLAQSRSFDEQAYGPHHALMNDRMNEQLEYIINDPRKNDAEIKALIENIRPDEDLPAENREGTPEGLKYPLVCLLPVLIK